MRLSDMGPLALTLFFASLFIAVILLALRVFVMGRVQTQRQHENRQETERLKSLVAAYRSDLRADLRVQLGLDPIPAGLMRSAGREA